MKKILFATLAFVAIMFLFNHKVFVVYADNGIIDGLFVQNNPETTSAYGVKTSTETLKNELLNAKDGDVIEYSGGKIDESLTVPKGVTLLLVKPYDYDSVGYAPFEIVKGVTVTVYGSLFVGESKDVVSPFSNLQTINFLKIDGEVIINGDIEIYLPVTGDGAITVCGTLKTPFHLIDVDSDRAKANEKVFPFSQCAITTVRCKTIINYGGKAKGFICFDGKFYGEANLVSDKQDALIVTENGAVVTFLPNVDKSVKKVINGKNLSYLYKTTVEISGVARTGEYKIELFDREFSLNSQVFSVPYNIDLLIDKNARFTVSENTKLAVLPGACVKTEEGSVLQIDGNLDILCAYSFDGKVNSEYPSEKILADYGFSKTADLICNGHLLINGAFSGIVQTKSKTAEITVSKDALLQSEIVGSFGCIESEKFNYTQFARVYGLNDFVNLEKDKTYKSYAISPFSLDFVTYESIENDIEVLKFYVQQYKNGRFLEYGDEGFLAELKLSLPTSSSGVTVNVNGKDYVTDLNGDIYVTAKFTKEDAKVKYYTPKFENGKNEREYLLTLDTDFVLPKVISSIKLSDDNDYVKRYDKEANGYFAEVKYYGKTSESVKVYPCYDDSNRYVARAFFTDGSFNNILPLYHDLYFYVSAFDEYKYAVNGLIDGDFIITDAKNAYQKYLDIVINRTEKEVEFVKTALKGYLDFSLVTDFENANLTYGDEEAVAIAVTLCGSKIPLMVKVSDYVYADGEITATIIYKGKYLSVDYTVTKKVTNVLPKSIVYSIADKSGNYLEEIKPLTGKIIKGALAFSDTEEIFILKTDATKTSKVGYYAIYGECGSPFYDVTFTNATYEITKLKVEVTVYDVVTDLAFNKAVKIDFTEPFRGVVKGFSVYLNNEKVAIIDLYGHLSNDLAVGKYNISPIIDDKNFIVDTKFSLLTVTNSDEELSVAFGLNGNKKQYDGLAVNLDVSVYDKVGDLAVNKDSFSVTITKDGKIVDEIKTVGTYEIAVSVSDKIFTTVYAIEPRLVNVFTDDVIYTYGDEPPKITFTTDFPVPVGIIQVAVANGKIVAKSLNENFLIENVRGNVKISKRKLAIEVIAPQKYYGDIDNLTPRIVNGTLANGDVLSNILMLKRADGEHVGSYDITASFVDENYQVTIINGVYKILPRKITVSSVYEEFIYGDEIKLSPVLLFGSLAFSDEINAVVKLSASSEKAVGVYGVKHEKTNGNYDVTFATEVYRILPKKITVSVPNVKKTYGEKDKITVVANAVLPYGDDVKDLVSLTREEGETVSVYKVFAKVNEGVKNYDVDVVLTNGSFSTLKIAPRDLKITVHDIAVEFTAPFATIYEKFGFTIAEGNLANGDQATLDYLIYTVEGDRVDVNIFGEPESIGRYEICAVFNDGNYSVTFAYGSLNVTKIRLGVKDLKRSFTYDETGKEVFSCASNLHGDTSYFKESELQISYVKVLLGGKTEPVSNVIGAGEYLVTLDLSSSTLYEFELDAETTYSVIVEKADIGKNLIFTPDNDYIIIGNNGLIARLFGYNCDVSLSIYQGENVVEKIANEGVYVVKAEVVDDNYTGVKTKTITAYKSVAPKIKEIENYLKEIKNSPDLRYKNLAKIKIIVSDFTVGDKIQIEDNSVYKPVIDDFVAEYDSFVSAETIKVKRGKTAFNNLFGDEIVAVFLGLSGVMVFLKNARGGKSDE